MSQYSSTGIILTSLLGNTGVPDLSSEEWPQSGVSRLFREGPDGKYIRPCAHVVLSATVQLCIVAQKQPWQHLNLVPVQVSFQQNFAPRQSFANPWPRWARRLPEGLGLCVWHSLLPLLSVHLESRVTAESLSPYAETKSQGEQQLPCLTT